VTGSDYLSQAWTDYRDELERIRKKMFEAIGVDAEMETATAWYLFHEIQTAAFNVAFAPRLDAPRFFVHGIFEPTAYGHTSPGCDYFYRKAFIDPTKRYRIWGKRSNSHMMTMQVMGGYWTAPKADAKDLGTYDFDQLKNDDGTFELIVSPTEPETGIWVNTAGASESPCLMVREFFYDWVNEETSELHIELLDERPGSPVHSGPELARRYKLAVNFIRIAIEDFSIPRVPVAIERVGVNNFDDAYFDAKHNNAGRNRWTGFLVAGYRVKQDEALIITMRDLDARYWGIQLSDRWHQTNDYIEHQSSLNGHQAIVDPDGAIRFVVAHSDPGIANWLDAMGIEFGGIDLRYITSPKPNEDLDFSKDTRPVLKTELVALADVGRRLYGLTATVTPQERLSSLAARRKGALRRYGY